MRRLAPGAVATMIGLVALGCSLFGPKTEHVSIAGGGVVRAMEIKIMDLEEGEEGLCPGRDYEIGIRVRTADGDTYTTWRKPPKGKKPRKAGHIDFSEFTFSLAGGEIDEHGVFHTDPDALDAAGSGYRIAAVVADDEEVSERIDLPLRLDCEMRIDASGEAGDDGEAGANGTEGAPEGGEGGVGGFGGNGGTVEVSSALVRTPFHDAAVLVRFSLDGGEMRHILADPLAPEGFVVDARGGNGGRGGDGGNGGTGGNGGKGGDGGDGGDGGSIRAHFDAGQTLLQSYMTYANSAGRGGEPGEGGGEGGRDAEGRPMLPGDPGAPGEPGEPGPVPDVRPESGAAMFPDIPERVILLVEPWIPPPGTIRPPASPTAAPGPPPQQ